MPNAVQRYTSEFWYRWSFRKKLAVLAAAGAVLLVFYLAATTPPATLKQMRARP